MINIGPRIYFNVNTDGNGGYYLWMIEDVFSIEHVVNTDSQIERTFDGKWIHVFECRHFWTIDQLLLDLNMRNRFGWRNIWFTKEIEGIVLK